MKVFVTFLLFASLSVGCKSQTCSSELEIICKKIEKTSWGYVGSQLTCFVDSSINVTFSDSSVTSVVHSSRAEVEDLAQITALIIVSAKEFKFIPSGIKNKLINLKALHIEYCGLLSVNKENLKQFGNSLEVLSLSHNKLISIDADLLEYNPNLGYIYLDGNPIRHIDAEFFTNLKKLKNIQSVYLNPANCMDQKFNTRSGHNIQTFKWKNKWCTDSTAKVETKKLISDNICTTSDEKLPNPRCEIIRECVYLSSNISDSVGTAISALKNELKTSIHAQEEKLTTLTDKTKESVDKLEKSIITHGDKLRAEIVANKETFASISDQKFEKVTKAIETLEGEFKTSIHAQDDKIKTMTQNSNERIEKLEIALNSLSDETRKSFDEIKIQMAEDSKMALERFNLTIEMLLSKN